MAGQLALIADGLSKRYPRRGQADRVALQPCSFRLAKGECLGVVGLNGAGKSTLLQLLCGTLWPSTGSV
ncbi:MAG: ATP-binding cassette domain-containing protein, partial [Alphaproteobacteria bacterium]|nr:ATP-binding cassette domain-containing protein [Alphaproteobacteria bacterium]